MDAWRLATQPALRLSTESIGIDRRACFETLMRWRSWRLVLRANESYRFYAISRLEFANSAQARISARPRHTSGSASTTFDNELESIYGIPWRDLECSRGAAAMFEDFALTPRNSPPLGDCGDPPVDA